MSGPLSQVLSFDHTTELLVALAVGVAFGFTLERAGFGRADNLAAIFYGRDFRVIRVMFTAIVTAMLGLYFLDLVGILPLYSIGILETFWLPQLVGGLILGAGFIIGGYCPGTSLVGSASGKIDAMLFALGLFGGSLAFVLGGSTLVPLQNATPMGRVLLHEFFGMSSSVVVLGVVLFAIGCFVAVGKIEALVNRGRAEL
jgi:uncharacterized protein